MEVLHSRKMSGLPSSPPSQTPSQSNASLLAPTKFRAKQSSDQIKTFKCRRKVSNHLCTYYSATTNTPSPFSSTPHLFLASLLLCLALFAHQLTTVSSALLLSDSSSSSSSSSLWSSDDSGGGSTSDDQQLKLIFTVSEGVPVGTFIGIIKSSNASLQVEPPFLIVPVPGGVLQPQSPSAVVISSSSSNSKSSEHHHKGNHHHNHHHLNNLPSATPQSGTVDTDLNIDQSTGEIRTAVELDREQRSHYSFIAISLTGINIHVKIVIDDINDNQPRFPTAQVELDFPENSKPRDVKRTLPPARDADRGVFGTQSYRIVSGNVGNAFRLVSHREKDDILYLDLQVNGVLDRESIPSYQLVVEALDGGQPPLKDQMTVKIAILDHNDCEPVFTQNHYFASVPENATLGTSVVKVTATDSDQAENGQVLYSLYAKNAQSGGTSPSAYFAVDRSTGWITVTKALDFEAHELHELVVIARDQGAQPLETSALVSIRTTDVNDNQPTISLLFLTETSKAEVAEDAREGDLIARVSVSDADASDQFSGNQQQQQQHRHRSSHSFSSKSRQSPANRLSVSLLGAGNEFGLRTQDHIVYLIVVTGRLDRERKAKYSLTVLVTGGSGTISSPSLNTSTTFELEVLDVNDNAPKFDAPTYTATLPEAADIGSSVFQMTATDADSDAFLTYAFLVPRQNSVDSDTVTSDSESSAEDESSSASSTFFLSYFNRHNRTHRLVSHTNWFAIDRRTGLIVTRTQVDCEADSEPHLTVLVTDSVPEDDRRFTKLAQQRNSGQGQGQLAKSSSSSSTSSSSLPPYNGFTATATLVVAISDINDFEPLMDQSFYNVTVREDESVGTCILQVSATDSDCGVNALVNYSFAATNSLMAPYSAMSFNSYRLPAPTANSRQQLSTGAQQHRFTTGSSNSKSNQQQYADFTIDPKTGQLCVARPLDFERTHVYDIPVLATDRGGLSTTAMLKIQVIDVNDNFPVFYPREYKVNVQADALEANRGERVPLVVVAATDLDSASQPNGQIQYHLLQTSGNDAAASKGLFEVDARTGQIFLVRPLSSSNSQQQQQQFRLNVLARDGGGLESKESALVQISVLPPATEADSRTAMPVFVQRQFSFSVSENVAQGAIVGTVRAKIEGAGADHHNSNYNSNGISYAIYSGDPDGYFSIDPRAGTISAKSGNIDRERYSHLLLNVQAYTGQYPGPYRYAHTQVNVTIVDENDNVPIFPSGSMKISIPENLPVDSSSPIMVAYAVDYDAGRFGEVRYSLYRGGDSSSISFSSNSHSDREFPFAIEEKTGHVLLRRQLDYESRSEYKLRVVATDGGQLSSEMTVDIFVQDTNDNAPVFVGTVLTAELGHSSSSSSAKVVPLYRVTVSENVPVNSHFYQIKATDADTGNNARLTYSLAPVPSSSKPSANSATMPIDIFPNNGILYLKDSLDREAVDRYEALVHVHDHGIPQQYNATALLRITVGDTNDNRPVWRKTSYSYSVAEDATVGTFIGAVEAFDVDLEQNGTVVYNITDAEGSLLFRINPSTGQIYLRGSLDREVKEHYEIAVEVRDQGTPVALVSDEKAVVSVTVLDVNDNRPSWNQAGEQDHFFEEEEANQGVVKVALGTSQKSIIAFFKATDPDAGENGTVRYSLTEPSEFFDMDAESGALITKVDIKEVFLKRKKVEKISLIASDGQGKKSKVKTVDVEFVDKRTIQNVNLENVETFDFVIQQYSSSSDSPLSFGYKVGSIGLPSSSSRPSSRNGRHHHLFCGNRLFSNFNRQLKDGIPFFVDSDEDDPKRLNVFLLNSLNDTLRYNLLLCVDWSQCSATLLHNHQERGQQQQQQQQQGSMQIPSCDHYAKINIELQRGSNFLCNPLPLENNDLYEVKIPWIAGGGGTGEQASGKRRINELLYLNQSALCNDQVTYELSSPMMDRETLNRLFTITSSTTSFVGSSSAAPSTLHFRAHEKSLIQRYLHQDFVLSLTARWRAAVDADERTTELVQSVPVRVKILSSDKAIGNIVFLNEKSLELEEDCCRVGAAILQARINVSHDDFRIRYFLASGYHGEQRLLGSDDQFTLNPDTGLLMLKRELDFERKHEHRVNITAVVYDSKSPIMSVSHVVKIRILNTNDESPVFVRRSYEKEVLENVRPGLVLLTVEAKDSDQQPPNSLQSAFNISYVLPGSYQHADYFSLNGRTGELKLVKALDREDIEHFHVPIYAFDEDLKHQALTLVHLRVLDVNDHPPRCVQASSELKVPESVAPGTVIYNVIAVDPDHSSATTTTANISSLEMTTSSSSLQYRILSGNVANKFVLHPSRGELSTNAPLDREMQSTYSLVVEVSDSFYSTTCNVTVELAGVNDNSPIFEKADYYAILDLDGTFGWLTVVTVRAIDSDGDKLLYTIDTASTSNSANTAGNLTRFFTINSETGEIGIHRSLVGPLFDLAKTNQLSFEVVAIEAMKRSYQSHQARTRVHLTLVNDGRDGAATKAVSGGVQLAKYPYVIIADEPREELRTGQEIGTLHFAATSSPLSSSQESKHNSGRHHHYHQKASTGSNNRQQSQLATFTVVHGGESHRSFNDYFSLNAQSGVITVRRPLGHNYYEALVEVTASEQQQQQQMSNSKDSSATQTTTGKTTTLVQIFIGGIDDRKFLKPIHLERISVAESQPVGAEVVNLGSYITRHQHHKHRFVLAHCSLPAYQNYFELDANSGVLRLRKQLDYEMQPSHIELTAFAFQSSGGNRPFFEEGYLYNLTLELVNVDDNGATFTQSHYVGTVCEGDPAGSYIARVNALDFDEPDETNISAILLTADRRYGYFIVEGNEDNAFSVDVDGVVRTNIVLDREIHDRYRLKVIATDLKQGTGGGVSAAWSADSFLADQANYQHLSATTVEVIVIDANDNDPVFPPHKEISVSEDAPVGAVVATWTANDVDIYPTLSYSKLSKSSATSNHNNSLQQALEELFDISLFTGRIFLKAPLKPLLESYNHQVDNFADSDVRKVHLSISASDQLHSVHTDLTINIKRNQSTAVPRFRKADGNFYLKLNLEGEHSALLYDVNVEVFRVPLLEQSSSSSSRKVIFGLENVVPEQNNFDSGFYIDQNRGVVYNNRTMRSVARSGRLLHLAITARYQDSDRVTRASLLINIERASLSSTSYFGSKKDAISSGHHNHHHQNVYNLEIDGSQIGVPLLRLPKQPSDSYVIISGNTNKNYLIMRGNELVLVSRPLTEQYSLKIKPTRSPATAITSGSKLRPSATSSSFNSSSMIYVHIKVKAGSMGDGLGSSPFKSSIFEVEISEAEKEGTEIQHLARGPSSSAGKRVSAFRFELFSGNEEGVFSVNADSGVLSVNRKLDFEQTSTYRLGVLAQFVDSSSSHFAIVNINLINANEYCPRFPSAFFKAIVDENSPPGTRVAPIRAIDQDKDLLNFTVVRLAGGGGSADSAFDLSGPFRYDAESGYLVTTGQLDFEQQLPHHHLSSSSSSSSNSNSLAIFKYILRVSDISNNGAGNGGSGNGGGIDSLVQCGSVETLLEVQIGSVDEFSPQFSSESYSFEVNMPASLSSAGGSLSGSSSGSTRSRSLKIGTVSAVDADLGPDGVVLYLLKSVSPAHLADLVQLNATSGLLSLSVARMRKKLAIKKNAVPKHFSLIVSASSGRPNSLHSLAMVDVKLASVEMDGGQSAVDNSRESGFIDYISEDEELELINSIDADRSHSSGERSRKDGTATQLPGWLIFLVVLLLLITVVLLVSVVVIRMHQAHQQELMSGTLGRPAANMGSLFRKIGPLVSGQLAGGGGGGGGGSGVDHLHNHHHGLSPAYSAAHYGTTGPLSVGPPCYSDATTTNHLLNGQSAVRNGGGGHILPLNLEGHSASSGRGSAEDDDVDVDDVDEEIRMINESSNVYYNTNNTDGLESGGEEQQITTTAEYLARLGVSNHYEEEQENTSSVAIEDDDEEDDDDDDDESTDVLSEMGVGRSGSRYGGLSTGPPKKLRPRMAGSSVSASGTIAPKNARVSGSSGSSVDQWPPMCGSLNSIIPHNEEELSGSYNWDYLQHWGPKYQPLSSVFAEIARLKSTGEPGSVQQQQQQQHQPMMMMSSGSAGGGSSHHLGNAADLLESMSNRSTTSTVSSRTRSLRHQQLIQQQLQQQLQQHQQQQSLAQQSLAQQHLPQHFQQIPQQHQQQQQLPSTSQPIISQQYPQHQYALQQQQQQQQQQRQGPAAPMSNYSIYGMMNAAANGGMMPAFNAAPPGSSPSSSTYNR